MNINERKVLIVDDDLLMQKLLCKLLSKMAFSCVTAIDGYEAMNILSKESISLVITDLNMPRMSGQELCNNIRAKTFGRYIYIIVITTHSDSASLVNSIQAGADDFISKPFSQPELAARIKSGIRVLELEATLEAKSNKLYAALEQIKIEQDDAKATLISLLPTPREIEGINFNWYFESSSFIGGDIFDYFLISETHLCFYMVDVSGHGVVSALQAFTIYNDMLSSAVDLKIMIDGKSLLTDIASLFLTKYNKKFIQKKRNNDYFTMFFGLIDFKTGELALVQAGHPSGLYLEKDNQDVQVVGEGGFPLGLIEDATYEAISMKMHLGSRLCIFSDGVTECENHKTEVFGQNKMIQLLKDGRHKNLREVLSNIESDLKVWKNFDEPYKDDVTCLMIEFRGDDEFRL